MSNSIVRLAFVGVGGVHLAAGEVPDQPRVDRAEGEVARRPARRPRVSSHSNLVPLKYGSSTSPVRCAHEGEVPGVGELVAAGGGAAVLPHDRAAVRLARSAVPRDDRLALVGDADRRDVVDVRRASTTSVERRPHGVPDLGGVVLDPARLREVLGELAVRRDRPAGRRRTRPGCGPRWCRRRWRSTHVAGHVSAASRSGGRWPGRFERPPLVRRVGAGRWSVAAPPRSTPGGSLGRPRARRAQLASASCAGSRTWPARSRTPRYSGPLTSRPPTIGRPGCAVAEEEQRRSPP